MGIDGRDVGLLLEREQDALLARTSAEVVRGVAGARVLERLGARHVLRAGGDVQSQQAAVVARVLAIEDWRLDVDGHPAERVDDVAEAVEVDLDVVRMSRPYRLPRIAFRAL